MAPKDKTPAADAAQIPTGNNSETAETNAAQREEFQRLLKLPLSQIRNLPQEQQELFWQESTREMLRMVIEAPGFINGMNATIETIKKELDTINPAALEPIIKIVDALLSDNARQVFQGLATLAPYMKAEVDEHPEKYDEQTGARELFEAATRRAREDGKEIPLEIVTRDEPEQEQLNLNFPESKEEIRRKNIKEAHRRYKLAQQQGALIAAAKMRLAIIADANLGFDYFTRKKLKKAPKEFDELLSEKDGKINLHLLNIWNGTEQQTLEDAEEIHTAFLTLLLSLANDEIANDKRDLQEICNENPPLTIYVPRLLNTLGIDPRPRERDKETKELIKRNATQEQTRAEMRRDEVLRLLRPFLHIVANWNGYLYPIVYLKGYDPESETLKIITPYIFKLIEQKIGSICKVFYPDLINANRAAFELACRIAMGVITRGVKFPDSKTYNRETRRQPIRRKVKKTETEGDKTTETLIDETFAPETELAQKKEDNTFSYRAMFSSLIAQCPQLKKEIEEIRSRQGKAEEKARQEGKGEAEIKAARQLDHKSDPQRINKKLKDCFTMALKFIMEKSDMPKYYKDLSIRTDRFDTFKAPTNSTLNKHLIITHHGKNPDFRETIFGGDTV